MSGIGQLKPIYDVFQSHDVGGVDVERARTRPLFGLARVRRKRRYRIHREKDLENESPLLRTVTVSIQTKNKNCASAVVRLDPEPPLPRCRTFFFPLCPLKHSLRMCGSLAA